MSSAPTRSASSATCCAGRPPTRPRSSISTTGSARARTSRGRPGPTAAQVVARFVADEPPPALVERVAATFRRSDGDVKAMLRTILASPEFWAPEARGAKIKKPFEYVASAVRAVDGHVADARAGFLLVRAAAEMGEGLYSAQPPTGYPDRAEAWVNAGALLARMNFALALTQGRLP